MQTIETDCLDTDIALVMFVFCFINGQVELHRRQSCKIVICWVCQTLTYPILRRLIINHELIGMELSFSNRQIVGIDTRNQIRVRQGHRLAMMGCDRQGRSLDRCSRNTVIVKVFKSYIFRQPVVIGQGHLQA